MSEKKIVVLDGMLKAARDAANEAWDNKRIKITKNPDNYFRQTATVILEAALRWLSENPIVPTQIQLSDLIADQFNISLVNYRNQVDYAAVEWQRRMFLASEPEVSPLVMYIMRHFDDLDCDSESLRNRAEAAISDFEEHKKRETRYK